MGAMSKLHVAAQELSDELVQMFGLERHHDELIDFVLGWLERQFFMLPEQTEAHRLMHEITHLPVEPSVFSVSVFANDHRLGYSAHAEFRHPKGEDAPLADLTARADTPEQALRVLLDNTRQLLGPCSHCGRSGPAPERE